MTTQPDSQFEEFWLQRLTLATAEPPYARTTAELLGTTKLAPIEVPGSLQGESGIPGLAAGFASWLHRLTGAVRFSLGHGEAGLRARVKEGGNALSGRVPLLFDIDRAQSFEALVKQTGTEMGKASELAAEARDLMLRLPEFVEPRYLCAVEVVDSLESRPASNAQLELVIVRGAAKAALAYDPASFDDATATRAARQLSSWLKHLAAEAGQPIGKIALVDAAERKHLTVELNQTAMDYPRDKCVHQLFEAQVARTPDEVAVVHAGRTLSYAQLNARANRLAHALIAAGAGPNKMVGLCVDRSEELVIGALAIQKAGAGYLPLDPAYPQDRIAFMAEDSGAGIIVCQQTTVDRFAGAERFGGNSIKRVSIDGDQAAIAGQSDANPNAAVKPEHLAYCIYTSGSTGKPKGVLIEHRNVVNFFTGMDAHIDGQAGKNWLAVTSLSFDISVLELFWTLGRGFKIVLAGEDRSYLESKRGPNRRPLDFSLFYFSSDEDPTPGPEKYRLLMEGARFADANGFAAVWTPERHFGAFGGIYPNPAVTAAAIAMITKNVQIRAGSCVVPLHHPARITEEWSLVDNLSNGRVAISFATGWHPKDFLLKPENYKERREVTLTNIETIRKLWRGEEVSFDSPIGPTTVLTRPRPVQKELPIWYTAAGNPATFETAGKIGANILTHLLGQSVQDLIGKIAAYRKAWKAAGHAGEGKVTLMLHTFVGDDDAEVKRTVRGPMKAYLRSSAELIGEHAWSFPAFKKVANQKESLELNFKKLSPQDMDDLLEYSFERYFEGSSLFGTPETCLKQIDRLKGLGVDEIACLIDFGVPTDDVLGMLPALNQLRQVIAEQSAEAAAPMADDDFSLSALIQRHEVSHLQCTPSMVRMLLANDDTRQALGRIRHLMVGGEAMTDALAKDIAGATGAKLSNMYGPTETTIWSSVDTVVAGQPITIGRPIANTQLYILDAERELAPQGAPGELWIAGDGVARGYHNRDDLTASRFAKDPFAKQPGARMYRTGDLVRHMDDGRIEFIGRVDHQVKLRGYRIELGEIEALLNQVPGIKESVVIVREDRAGDPRLVAYLMGEPSAIDAGKLKDALGAKLPDYMVPSAFVRMDRFPLTPNKKVDRKALPAPSEAQKAAATEYVRPESEVEEQIASVYQAVLGLPQVGREDHFFDLGGHSLLAVQAHRKLREVLGRDLSITDIFRFPTVRALASHLQSDGAAADARLDASSQRASARREAMMRRRGARPT